MSEKCCNPNRLRAESYGKLAQWALEQQKCYEHAAFMEEELRGIRESYEAGDYNQAEQIRPEKLPEADSGCHPQ